MKKTLHTCTYYYDTYGPTDTPYGYQTCGPRPYGNYQGITSFFTTAKTHKGLVRAAYAAACNAAYRDNTGYMERICDISGE